jgi:hypothetical protein
MDFEVILERVTVVKRRCTILITFGLLALAASLLFWVAQSPRYDVNRVEPRLRSLKQPISIVETVYYMDGGSIGIELIDREGKKEQFASPSHLGSDESYVRVFVGAMHDSNPGAVEVADSERNKRSEC